MLFEIAHSLRMPLYQLLREMPYDELLGWAAFFEQRPVGQKDDLRTMYLLQAQGVKVKPGDLFPSLAVKTSKSTKLEGSVMFSKMLNAVGGDKLEFLHENKLVGEV